MGNELLDTEQVARICGLSEVTLRKWRITGTGPPFVRLGRSIRYSRDDLTAYLAERAFSSTTEADMAGISIEAA